MERVSFYVMCRGEKGSHFVKPVKGYCYAKKANGLPALAVWRERDGLWSMTDCASGLRVCAARLRRQCIDDFECYYRERYVKFVTDRPVTYGEQCAEFGTLVDDYERGSN